ncbi:hypothetical protein SBA7_10057 [Candidatus Sulfotelmatobacter sp. SbA7]|nr:hypothetical protein SBA7_10057 [Candidatus Sulfotelmatobacter sp. SbA7]
MRHPQPHVKKLAWFRLAGFVQEAVQKQVRTLLRSVKHPSRTDCSSENSVQYSPTLHRNGALTIPLTAFNFAPVDG